MNDFISVISIIISVIVAYFTTRITLEKEKNTGKIRLLEIVKKYYISVHNSFDSNTKQIIDNAISKEQYLRVLENIELELSNLISNDYYTKLLLNYPDLTMLHIQVSREIAEQRNNTKFGLNPGTAKQMYNLYVAIKKNISHRLLKTKLKETCNLIEGYNGIINDSI